MAGHGSWLPSSPSSEKKSTSGPPGRGRGRGQGQQPSGLRVSQIPLPRGNPELRVSQIPLRPDPSKSSSNHDLSSDVQRSQKSVTKSPSSKKDPSTTSPSKSSGSSSLSNFLSSSRSSRLSRSLRSSSSWKSPKKQLPVQNSEIMKEIQRIGETFFTLKKGERTHQAVRKIPQALVARIQPIQIHQDLRVLQILQVLLNLPDLRDHLHRGNLRSRKFRSQRAHQRCHPFPEYRKLKRLELLKTLRFITKRRANSTTNSSTSCINWDTIMSPTDIGLDWNAEVILGKGSFGKVILARRRWGQPRILVGVKIMDMIINRHGEKRTP